ncbi:MAG: ribonuclease R [Pseudomonadales bacterium]|nr:ribonuclease R [Pseudomonadales bacterium]
MVAVNICDLSQTIQNSGCILAPECSFLSSLMPKSRKSADPFAARESENYANPIPSREFILEHLEALGAPASFATLCEQLELESEERIEGLRRRLIAMSRDGQIISNRKGVYGLATHMDLIKGIVQGTKDGVGYLIPEDGTEDLFLNLREMEKLFDGDEVLARFSGFESRGRKEGTVVEILKRRYTEIVGRLFLESGFGIVIADSKRVSHEILIPEKHLGNAKEGEFVVAEITEYPSRRRKAIGKILEVLGDNTTPGLEIEVAVRSHGLPHTWPNKVRKEVARLPNAVAQEETADRFDLRDVPFVTIDGEDAKDFDDAVFAHRHQRGNWTLYVAIADVSNYVQLGSSLDEEAINRGTSVYFPGHVIPMLPEQLSNGLCSLKPKVDRLAMICEMEISAEGHLTDFSFYEGVIHSHARMTYTEVADILVPARNATQEKVQQKVQNKYKPLLKYLEDLYTLYKALRLARENDGAMDFESTETRIVFGEDKKIKEIVPVERTDAHRLIEESMLCANVAAARLLEQSKTPALYRTHEGPNVEKLENVREFLSELGLYLGGGEKPSPDDYSQLLNVVATRPDRHLLQTMLIRSMMQAVYQAENTGHFGLGFPAYTHFTSPIRRYPDLLVHRAIRYLVRNKSGAHTQKSSAAKKLNKSSIYPYGESEIESFGVSCSAAERRADAAGYSVIDWLKCEYMLAHVGDEFPGTITSVTSFGLFVELDDIYIEGLIHISELSNDYYHFDPVRHCLEGERSNQIYRLGDRLEAKVVRVDLEEKKIDLQIKGSKSKKAQSGRPGKRSKGYKRKQKGNKEERGKKRTSKKTRTRQDKTKPKKSKSRKPKKQTKKSSKSSSKKPNRNSRKKTGKKSNRSSVKSGRKRR